MTNDLLSFHHIVVGLVISIFMIYFMTKPFWQKKDYKTRIYAAGIAIT
jgi:hypothetical protein